MSLQSCFFRWWGQRGIIVSRVHTVCKWYLCSMINTIQLVFIPPAPSFLPCQPIFLSAFLLGLSCALPLQLPNSFVASLTLRRSYRYLSWSGPICVIWAISTSVWVKLLMQTAHCSSWAGLESFCSSNMYHCFHSSTRPDDWSKGLIINFFVSFRSNIKCNTNFSWMGET